jgi:asparagine synthase (glutamine-hydrolysing)
MCGIFFLLQELTSSASDSSCTQGIFNSAMKIRHRGPDQTVITEKRRGDYLYYMIFHRLSINGLSMESGQPLNYPYDNPKYTLMCNGEIYNFKNLIEKYDIQNYHSGSDCEIILHLYDLFQGDIRRVLNEIKGVYAFVIWDNDKIITARDPLGVRSLYYFMTENNYGVCSELKGLYDLSSDKKIHQFPGGHYSILDTSNFSYQVSRYYDITTTQIDTYLSEDHIISEMIRLLYNSVEKRLMCDRETTHGIPAIGAFLSGGFDSSTIAGILSKILPGNCQLHTFSIGFKDAPDLKAAREVADYIGSIHHEVVVTEEEMTEILDIIPQVIESYDITTVRASAFMYKLSQYIRDNTDIVVLFSGEGIDELMGSYLYFHNAPSTDEYHHETLRLMNDLHYFDLLRGDKCTASMGLELRVPFLDIDFVNFVKQISPEWKLKNGIEKYILRKTVSQLNVIPQSICWRTKEAMSDGVSLDSRSWHHIIQNYIKNKAGDQSDEKQYFLKLFQNYYPGCEDSIPYYWLPKWSGDVSDPSARVLDVYKCN